MQESLYLSSDHTNNIPSGHDPSRIFHRKVNKRSMPDYYDIIKEPVALSTLKSKLLTKDYQNFSQFVRDCALISHNAQTYNRPEAGAYQDALVIRELFEKEFKQLAEENIITAEEAILPDLGEIPPVTPRQHEEEEEEEDDDDEDDEDEDMDDSDDDGKKKRKRGPRSTAAITKREGGSKEDSQKGADVDPRKRRGRPPRVDTPMEARIKAVLKGIRKFKNDAGNIMIHQFEKLPDKILMPEYYGEIKDPIAIELIKVSVLFGIRNQSCRTTLTFLSESINAKSTSQSITSSVTSTRCSTTPKLTTKMRVKSIKTPCICRYVSKVRIAH